jgi:RNA polymerase sigma-70 factor (ECF subfamily)
MVTNSLTLELIGTAPAGALPVEASQRVRDIVARNLDAVWRSARRLGLSDADLEDLAQEVVLVVMKREASIEPGKERAFLLAAAVRIAANWRRSRRRQSQRSAELAVAVAGESEVQAAAAPAQERELERAHGLSLLDAALSEMTEPQRVAFVLFELEELSAKEIAEQLEVPEAAVVSRVRRAREEFQRFCRQYQRGVR